MKCLGAIRSRKNNTRENGPQKSPRVSAWSRRIVLWSLIIINTPVS